MKKIIFIALAVLLVGGSMVAFVVWPFVFREAGSDVSSKKAEVEISATDLVAQFEGDENAANTLFLGKIIIVSGKVESVNYDSSLVSVYFKRSEDVSGVLCNFSTASRKMYDIEIGMSLKVKGICTGYPMDVVLNKCSVEE